MGARRLLAQRHLAGDTTVKRHPKGAKQRTETIQVWTYSQALGAVPYIASIVRSIREHALEALSYHRTARRLADRPGRPDRSGIIAQKEAEEQARRADDQFHEAVNELEELDVFCLDPIQGQALIPFVHDEQLAWYIFDLHDAQPFRFWRFQSDPEDTRRPVTPKQKGAETTRVV
jgi:hypothetical protein